MPYIKRDEQGRVVAVSLEPAPGFDEQVNNNAPELSTFIALPAASLEDTDQDFIRVLEDVVELLIDKGLILFTELPQSAQDKIMRRQRLRSEMSGRLDLIGDD